MWLYLRPGSILAYIVSVVVMWWIGSLPPFIYTSYPNLVLFWFPVMWIMMFTDMFAFSCLVAFSKKQPFLDRILTGGLGGLIAAMILMLTVNYSLWVVYGSYTPWKYFEAMRWLLPSMLLGGLIVYFAPPFAAWTSYCLYRRYKAGLQPPPEAELPW